MKGIFLFKTIAVFTILILLCSLPLMATTVKARTVGSSRTTTTSSSKSKSSVPAAPTVTVKEVKDDEDSDGKNAVGIDLVYERFGIADKTPLLTADLYGVHYFGKPVNDVRYGLRWDMATYTGDLVNDFKFYSLMFADMYMYGGVDLSDTLTLECGIIGLGVEWEGIPVEGENYKSTALRTYTKNLLGVSFNLTENWRFCLSGTFSWMFWNVQNSKIQSCNNTWFNVATGLRFQM